VRDTAWQRTPVVLSFTMSASATVALVLLFLPKVYIMIFKPEKNDRSAFTTTRDVRCHIGRAAGLSHQHSLSTSGESFDRSVTRTRSDARFRRFPLKLKTTNQVNSGRISESGSEFRIWMTFDLW